MNYETWSRYEIWLDPHTDVEKEKEGGRRTLLKNLLKLSDTLKQNLKPST